MMFRDGEPVVSGLAPTRQDGPRHFFNTHFGRQLMVEIDPALTPSDGTSAAPEGNTPRSLASGPEPSPVGTSRLLVFCLVAALLAGTASSLAGEAIMHEYGANLSPPVKRQLSPEEIQRWHGARLYCPAATFSTMGGLLGLAMGMAGGLARGSIIRGAWAAIVGFLLGTIVATSAALVFVSLFYKKHDPETADLVLPMLMHGAIWSAVGAIGGLAFGLAARAARSLESDHAGKRTLVRRGRGDGRLRARGSGSPLRTTRPIFPLQARPRREGWRLCCRCDSVSGRCGHYWPYNNPGPDKRPSTLPS